MLIQIIGKVVIDDEVINCNIEGLKRKGKFSYFVEVWVCCWDQQVKVLICFKLISLNREWEGQLRLNE